MSLKLAHLKIQNYTCAIYYIHIDYQINLINQHALLVRLIAKTSTNKRPYLKYTNDGFWEMRTNTSKYLHIHTQVTVWSSLRDITQVDLLRKCYSTHSYNVKKSSSIGHFCRHIMYLSIQWPAASRPGIYIKY